LGLLPPAGKTVLGVAGMALRLVTVRFRHAIRGNRAMIRLRRCDQRDGKVADFAPIPEFLIETHLPSIQISWKLGLRSL